MSRASRLANLEGVDGAVAAASARNHHLQEQFVRRRLERVRAAAFRAIARRILHRLRVTLGVHEDDGQAGVRGDASSFWIVGQSRDVIDDVGASGN